MKLKNWICDGNDCSKCKYCWEEKTSYEYEEYDCGCYIKGSDYDEKPCHLINPMKFILGTLAKRKANYYMAHKWDGFAEFIEKSDKMDNKLSELFISKVIGKHSICWKDSSGKLHELDTKSLVETNIWEVRLEYEDFAHPIEYKKLSTEWKELIKKTCKCFYRKTIGRIVPYLHS